MKKARSFIYTIAEIFPLLEKGKLRFILDGRRVTVNSKLKSLLFSKGFDCAGCGVKGQFFVVKENLVSRKGKEFGGVWNLHLYGIKDGKEVQLTIDHVIPLSRSGSGKLKNLQLMCFPCNQKKGNEILTSTTLSQD